ncbi:MAG: hypothetical protein ACRDR6_11005 [Pseudonocardiaceae bacterium]
MALDDPEFVIANVTGPAGTLVGCGSQPVSDSVILTSVLGWLVGVDPLDPPQPATATAVETRTAATRGRSARGKVTTIRFPLA